VAHARPLLSLLIAAPLAAVGCGGEPARPATPVSTVSVAPREPPGSSDLTGGKWGDFVSKRFDLTVPLPDGRAWRIDDRSSSWLTAKHEASSSELAIRIWNEPDLMNRARCEERARLSRPLPDRARSDVLRRDPVAVPFDFDTIAEIGIVAPPAAGAPIEGFVMAFGGRVRRCFAYLYLTRAVGPAAEQKLGVRLATMADGSLGGMRHASDLSPHIQRDPGK
jgi:hypothetical protein